MFQPGGFLDGQCQEDLTSYLKQQIAKECGPLKNVDPATVCNQAFSQLWCQLDSAALKAEQCAAPACGN